MLRKIIHIDEDKCVGCGLCTKACQEGAIKLIDGKAKLIRDDYCDGLGNCLPVCPTNAISFVEREAAAYDKEAVAKSKASEQSKPLACGCPGTNSKRIERQDSTAETMSEKSHAASQLSQWPVQIKLVPVNAPYFDGCKLLVAADCTAFARGDFHERFIKNHVTIIGCPKLDAGDYAEKLTEIIKHNDIKSVTIARMEVPCCGGLENAVKQALQASGKFIPWQIVTIATDGRILE